MRFRGIPFRLSGISIADVGVCFKEGGTCEASKHKEPDMRFKAAHPAYINGGRARVAATLRATVVLPTPPLKFTKDTTFFILTFSGRLLFGYPAHDNIVTRPCSRGILELGRAILWFGPFPCASLQLYTLPRFLEACRMRILLNPLANFFPESVQDDNP
jgi:hypothetical protein